MGGGNIVQGYHKMPEKTKEDFTDIDGTWYFCSGDIGQMDPDGCLRVIGMFLKWQDIWLPVYKFM